MASETYGNDLSIRVRPNCDDAVLRLFCLPYAGGSASVFRGWNVSLGEDVVVVGVECPGHGRRIREKPLGSADALVKLLAEELREEFEAGPFALYGHSMGGLLAFQLTHELRRLGLPCPRFLVLSSVRAPRGNLGVGLGGLSDHDLREMLDRLGGAPSDALADDGLMELMLPIVRADLRLVETWDFTPDAPLRVPVSLLSGEADPLVPPGEMDRWRRFFAGQVGHCVYAGGHFYFASDSGQMLRDLAAAISTGTALSGRWADSCSGGRPYP
jgi:medium-chain acyl-[acyl-carrier-protein] hydrolase